jgi:hypothetical protein
MSTEMEIGKVDPNGTETTVVVRARTRAPLDKSNGKEAMEFARKAASLQGFRCDAIRGQTGVYPVDESGQTPDALLMPGGEARIAGWQSDFTFTGRL